MLFAYIFYVNYNTLFLMKFKNIIISDSAGKIEVLLIISKYRDQRVFEFDFIKNRNYSNR